jgi:cyclic pyranopterin phosphate synthase
MGMVDVSGKAVISREAEAAGVIVLSRETMECIRRGEVKKGDPLLVAEIAGMSAAKQTHLLIPHCHQIPLETVRVSFDLSEANIDVHAYVKAHAKTGVEMEALVAVSLALCTIWDMVKYLEKDTAGQYPATRIQDIRVVRKVKAHA